MLLDIYLVTTAVSYATAFISAKACENKLKRKGYKFAKEKKSFSEKLAGFLFTVVRLSLPGYNILNALAIICMGDKHYDNMENRLLEAGIIYLLNDEESINNCECQVLNDEEVKIDANIAQLSRDIKEKMSTDEKINDLRQERKKITDLQQQRDRSKDFELNSEMPEKPYVDYDPRGISRKRK